jgi:hemin uptake protein HemP
MTEKENEHDPQAANPQTCEPRPEPRILRSEDLFAGQKTIVIQHGAELYRLLITRNDRLILQK